MPVKCCIPNCKMQIDEPKGFTLSFYRVPPDETRRKKWHDSINRYFNLEFRKFSYVCSLHFEKDCFNNEYTNQKRLKKNSYPTIFIDFKELHESLIPNIEIDETKIKDASNNFNSNGTNEEPVNDQEIMDHKKNIDVTSEEFSNSNVSESQITTLSNYTNEDANITCNDFSLSETNNATSQANELSSEKSVVKIDLDSVDCSPIVKKLLQNAQSELISMQKKIKRERMKIYRYQNRIKKLNTLVRHVNHKYIPKQLSNFLKSYITFKYTFWKHTKEKIFIILDGCHVLKLVRNSLGRAKIMYDEEEQIISWSHIVALNTYQEENGLNTATKLRKAHIFYNQNIMNVKLAAQTLSKSVSIALCVIKDLGEQEFQNINGTAKFCRNFNDAFYILNFREQYAKDEGKVGISDKNLQVISNKIRDIVHYVKGLKLSNGVLVLNSEIKCGFFGFILSLQNVLNVYKVYYEPINAYLLTYKLSQDHLETFFSAIRSKGGHNNNPTCYQFIHSFKKLLIHAHIKGSENANSISLDNTEMLETVYEELTDLNGSNVSVNENYIDNSQLKFDVNQTNFYGEKTNKKYIDSVVEYLAGFVLRTLLIRNNCMICPVLLTEDVTNSNLLKMKNKGGLIKPCSDIVTICKIIEKIFRLFYFSRPGIYNELFKKCFNAIPEDLLAFNHSEQPGQHRIYVIKKIIGKYLSIRVKHFEAQKKEKTTTKRIRRTYTKLILFKNQ